ncbi:YceI family protein [Maribellus sp. YY47]|uniref:YceI family protein n=1 Tax=Maribellus sp. YY47 TaxID=2929486 RepID=UPI002001CEC3|nr:YceI family protein [Maribellus sp. YY47]MCK3685096.1 YceI family protein [Maribellus sp. YY47]
MKKLGLAVVLVLAVSVASFAQKKEVNKETSAVNWTGKKIGGSHNGAIQLKGGYFEFNNDQIVGGEVVIDMNSITNADLEDPGYNEKLVGHLKSDDFFGVEKYPTAKFVVTKASKFEDGKAKVTGKLTIKKSTEEITFDVVKSGNIYKALVEVDRSKYDVRYGSNSFFDNLGDKAINDIFTLDISLVL